jgi:hypothetical protein
MPRLLMICLHAPPPPPPPPCPAGQNPTGAVMDAERMAHVCAVALKLSGRATFSHTHCHMLLLLLLCCVHAGQKPAGAVMDAERRAQSTLWHASGA